MNRDTITQLLQAGLSDKAIARQAHCRHDRVRKIRAELGIPPRKPGPQPADPVALYWQRTQPTPDGHRLLPGAGGQLRGGDNKIRAARVAFLIGNDREPVGPVTSGCGVDGCIHPQHVEDQPMRQQYKAIFGEEAA
ncbi:hypothetical protein PV405_29925 [Streptomyces sp. ME02-6979-3A]|uniref:hypothetical protein n=1 Tax=Streptomyces sp. ME02-6979-3A TaxID=3028673 RepID=UPI0029BA7AE4|nr:hypothetical protein [Streptomyces sp. ME02-6979-3A]MDX3328831.1 hypothetical protein [Streptomyces sp. ME02-6979-3A]